MQKITPFLWFENQAEEAVNHYVSIFSHRSGNSKILATTYYNDESAKVSGQPKGSIMTISFQLAGQNYMALNGGEYFKFSGAISFVVNCLTQEEVDYYWEKLSEGGEEGECGWINRDKFGITWQVVPTILDQLLNDPNEKKANAVMATMLKMKKIDIEELKKAYENN